MKSIDRLKKKTSPSEGEPLFAEQAKVVCSNDFFAQEAWKILHISDLTYLEKCFIIAILIKLDGKRTGMIKMEELRKSLNISLNGYKNKNILKKKAIFTFKSIALTGTEVTYLGVEHLLTNN